MKVHPRQAIVAAAGRDLAERVADWLAVHKLSPTEEVICLHAEVTAVLQRMVRDERHPDEPEKRGGEA